MKSYTDTANPKTGVSYAVMAVVEYFSSDAIGFARYYLDSSWQTLSAYPSELKYSADKKLVFTSVYCPDS